VVAGAALAAAIAWTTLADYRELVRRPGARAAVRPKLESRFERWLRRPEAARRVFPVDPVQAQAFGWLDRERVETTRVWGELPATGHVRRARQLAARRRGEAPDAAE
jgi:hypothetical protein